MANRNFVPFLTTPIKGLVALHARVTIGATGAPTLTKFTPPSGAVAGAFESAPTTGPQPYSIGTEGVKSISRVSAGVYLVTLQDTYVRFLGAFGWAANATGLPTTVNFGGWTTTDVTSLTAPTIKFTTQTATATAGDPASGDVLDLWFLLSSSTALG